MANTPITAQNRDKKLIIYNLIMQPDWELVVSNMILQGQFLIRLHFMRLQPGLIQPSLGMTD